LDGDHVTLLHQVGGDVDLLAVDPEMAVVDELASLGAGLGQAGPPHHVVETALEDLQQVVAGDARATLRLLVVAAELALDHPVHVAELLLLAELDLVVALADAAASMLARRIGTTLDGALLRLAQRGTRPTASLVPGSGVTSHLSLSDASWDGRRCGGWG